MRYDAAAEGDSSNAGSPIRGGHNAGGAGRRAFLTPDRVAHRFHTLIDAFNTADRKQRGHLPYDRILEIYALYFHNSVGQLQDEELATFVEKFSRHAGDGSIVVDYPRLADALKKRDLEMMAKAEARALRQVAGGGATAGAGLSFATPERPSPGAGRAPYTPLSHGGGVAAALRMVEDGGGMTRHGLQGRPRPPPLADLGAAAEATSYSPGGGGQPHSNGRRERGMQGVGGGGAAATPALGPGTTSPGYAGGEHGGGYTVTGQGGAYASGVPSPVQMQTTQYGSLGAAAAGSLQGLLQACEAVDDARDGRLHGAQLLTCCRMQGIPESSAMLRAMIDDSAGVDGRVEYVNFVQQLAAQRAGGAARASLVQRSSPQQPQQ